MTILVILLFFIFKFYSDLNYNNGCDKNCVSKFSFVNKSFNRDLYKTLHLYQSFEAHIGTNNKFYIIIPQKDYYLFEREFNKALRSKIIKKRPIIVSDEEVFDRCKIDRKVQADIPGYLGQQIVKMCFYKISDGDYMTIDSDGGFVQKIDVNKFYYNGFLRTVYGRIKKPYFINQKIYPQQTLDAFYNIYKYLKIDSSWLTSYVAGAGLWSKEEMKNLVDFMLSNYQMNIYDMINNIPYEMQWYGAYVERYGRFAKYNASNFFIVDYHNSPINKDFYDQQCIVDKNVLLIICQDCRDKHYEQICDTKQTVIYFRSLLRRFLNKLF